MTKYTLGGVHAAAMTELPELDQFMAELEALCRRFNVGFDLEYDYDERRELVATCFEAGDLDIFAQAILNSSDSRIEWLTRAQEDYRAKMEVWFAQRKAEAAAAEKKRREERAAEVERQRAKLVEEGMVLNGKRYKLVPE